MTDNCTQLEDLLTRGPIASSNPGLLRAHLGKCERCQERLDAVDDPTVVIRLLGSLAEEDEGDDSELDALERDEGVRIESAVEDVLLPQMNGVGTALLRAEGARIHAFDLVDGIEAVSLLISSELRRLGAEQAVAFLAEDGSVEIGRKTFSAKSIATTIERATELTRDAAERLAKWLYLAAREQIRLFPHVQMAAVNAGISTVPLARVPASEQEHDPWKRWHSGLELEGVHTCYAVCRKAETVQVKALALALDALDAFESPWANTTTFKGKQWEFVYSRDDLLKKGVRELVASANISSGEITLEWGKYVQRAPAMRCHLPKQLAIDALLEAMPAKTQV